jgi:hypothetical protein
MKISSINLALLYQYKSVLIEKFNFTLNSGLKSSTTENDSCDLYFVVLKHFNLNSQCDSRGSERMNIKKKF